MSDLRKAAEMALEALEEFCEMQTMLRPIERRDALRQALAQPVDAVNISADRVDETAKGEHDLWIAAACLKSTVEAAIKAGDWKVDGACDPTRDLQYLANCFSSIQNREWVGLTEEERSYYLQAAANVGWWQAALFVEAKLKEKNSG